MPKDVDLNNGRVAVLHGKGDRARVVALDPAACAVLERWARERRPLGLTGRQPFFCVVSKPSRGLPMRASYVRELLHDLADKAGVEKRVHPHGLRHTYASYLLEQGVPIHHIRRMLGHSSLAITERYADHINPAEVVEGLRSLSWPSAPR
jgi:site-specific recombinase XerD